MLQLICLWGLAPNTRYDTPRRRWGRRSCSIRTRSLANLPSVIPKNQMVQGTRHSAGDGGGHANPSGVGRRTKGVLTGSVNLKPGNQNPSLVSTDTVVARLNRLPLGYREVPALPYSSAPFSISSTTFVFRLEVLVYNNILTNANCRTCRSS